MIEASAITGKQMTEENIEEVINLLGDVTDAINKTEEFNAEGKIKKTYSAEDVDTNTTLEYAKLYKSMKEFSKLKEFVMENRKTCKLQVDKWEKTGYKKMKAWIGNLIDDDAVVYTLVYNF